jgi:MFS family permease
VGAALLSETWPKNWRPWLAAVLQTAVNVGIVAASAAAYLMAALPHRYVFLVGIAPALVTLWIRRAVPETAAWQEAKLAAGQAEPGVADLFRGDVRRITVLTILVCSLSLTAHWAFVFWSIQQLRSLPEVAAFSDTEQSELVSQAFMLLMVSSIVGNFLYAALAQQLGYRRSIALGCLFYFASLALAYGTERDYRQILWFWPFIGAASGLFALFTMYMPPLFPTLLRTTGAGFCYNIGRIAAAAGTVFFGLFSQVSDFRTALFFTAFMFVPTAAIAWFLPDVPDQRDGVAPVE